jgi:hypothetical protein
MTLLIKLICFDESAKFKSSHTWHILKYIYIGNQIWSVLKLQTSFYIFLTTENELYFFYGKNELY